MNATLLLGPSIVEVLDRHHPKAPPTRMLGLFVDVAENVLYVCDNYVHPGDNRPPEHFLEPMDIDDDERQLRVVTRDQEVTLKPWQYGEDPAIDTGVASFRRYLSSKRRTYLAERARVMGLLGRQ